MFLMKSGSFFELPFFWGTLIETFLFEKGLSRGIESSEERFILHFKVALESYLFLSSKLYRI